MITSNHAVGDDQPATLSRLIQVPTSRSSDGDRLAWDDLKEAQRKASGCLPTLIKLGYPASEIRVLCSELRHYLPHAHPRLADSFGLILWYSLAVCRLAGFDGERIKAYVINNLCRHANNADSAADSLTDFLEKLSALRSQSLVGDWNVKTIESKEQGKVLAVVMPSAWNQLDKRFNPPYSRKVVEALIVEKGGKLNQVAKFHRTEDESKAYYRALINPRTDTDGKAVLPFEPPAVSRKCAFIPIALVKNLTKVWEDTPTQLPELPSVTCQLPDDSNCCNPDLSSNLDTLISPVTDITNPCVVSEKIDRSEAGNEQTVRQLSLEDLEDAIKSSNHTSSEVTQVTGNEKNSETKAEQELQQLPDAELTSVTGGNCEVTSVTGVENPQQLSLELPVTLKFSLGDRVRVADKEVRLYGDVGIIQSVDDAKGTPPYYVNACRGSAWFWGHQLEKADNNDGTSGGEDSPPGRPPQSPSPGAGEELSAHTTLGIEGEQHGTNLHLLEIGDRVEVIDATNPNYEQQGVVALVDNSRCIPYRVDGDSFTDWFAGSQLRKLGGNNGSNGGVTPAPLPATPTPESPAFVPASSPAPTLTPTAQDNCPTDSIPDTAGDTEVKPGFPKVGDSRGLKVFDRIRVNVGERLRPHGKTGQIIADKLEAGKLIFVCQLDVQPHEHWMRIYEAEPEWLERID